MNTAVRVAKLFVFGIAFFLSTGYLLRTYAAYASASNLVRNGYWTTASLFQVRGKPQGNIFPTAEVTYIFWANGDQHTISTTRYNYSPDNIGDPSAPVCYLPSDTTVFYLDPKLTRANAFKPFLLAIGLWIGSIFLIALNIIGGAKARKANAREEVLADGASQPISP